VDRTTERPNEEGRPKTSEVNDPPPNGPCPIKTITWGAREARRLSSSLKARQPASDKDAAAAPFVTATDQAQSGVVREPSWQKKTDTRRRPPTDHCCQVLHHGLLIPLVLMLLMPR
jgi:hypothetical protein